jgi:hypothetical protein
VQRDSGAEGEFTYSQTRATRVLFRGPVEFSRRLAKVRDTWRQWTVTVPRRSASASFETSPGARIVLDTFKVLYGLLKIDVTSKIRPYAVVSEHGLLAEEAVLPPGTHRLILQISDSAGRTAESEVKLTVVVGSHLLDFTTRISNW